MQARHIVPVDPADHGDVVVVEVLQEGSHPLDVRLVGCEGESPYVTTISHRNIARLKTKFKGDDDEWAQILSHFLLQKLPEDVKLLEGVRVVYTLSNDALKIAILQDIRGIKLILGEIILPKDEAFVLNPFEWAQVSAQAHTCALQELVAYKARANTEKDAIAKLNAQLDEFIKAKDETEAAMLQQFMALLNEKKRKIRDQGRLLATAKVDAATAATVRTTREESKPRKAAAFRTSKRKAKAPEPEPESEPDPEQYCRVDQMEIDQVKVEEQAEESGIEAATPERASETETEDEGDAPSKAAALPARITRGQSAASSSKATPAAEEDISLPPRRELPFGRPATRSAASRNVPPPKLASEDDTDDEEL